MEINWNNLRELLLKKWKVFVVFLLIIFAYPIIKSIVFEVFLFPQYTASASLVLTRTRGSGLQEEIVTFYGDVYGLGMGQSREKSLVTSVLKSNSLAEDVIYEINLNHPYWRKYLNTKIDVQNMTDKTSIETHPYGLRLVQKLKSSISTGKEEGQGNLFSRGDSSQLYVISSTMPNYEVAYDVLNGYLKSLAKFMKQNDIGISFLILDRPIAPSQQIARSFDFMRIFSSVRRGFVKNIGLAIVLSLLWIAYFEWRKNKLKNIIK